MICKTGELINNGGMLLMNSYEEQIKGIEWKPLLLIRPSNAYNTTHFIIYIHPIYALKLHQNWNYNKFAECPRPNRMTEI